MGRQGFLSKKEALRLRAAVFLLRLFLRDEVGKAQYRSKKVDQYLGSECASDL